MIKDYYSKYKKELFASLFGINVAIILWLTVFGRSPIDDSSLKFQMFHSFRNVVDNIFYLGLRSNFLGNISLFIPIGVLLPLAFDVNAVQTVKIGFLLSLVVEILQLVSSKGYFEVDDLLCNSIGCLLGFVLEVSFRKMMAIVLKNNNKIIK